MNALSIFLTAGFYSALVRMATPLIFGSIGELIGQRCGVMNLGIEGIMTAGAMVAWVVALHHHDLWLALLAAALVGASFGLIHSLFTVYVGVSQHVTGIAVTLLASSAAAFGLGLVLPSGMSTPRITPFEQLSIPLLSRIPVIGEALFSQAPLTYVAILIVIVVSYLFNFTPLGLAMRMCGENPQAVERQGIRVRRIRTGAVACGAALMGVGGAFFTLSEFNAFYVGMINGRGWICVALVIFSGWRPGKAMLGALLFAALDAFQMRVQQEASPVIPYQIYLAMPYLVSVLALIVASRQVSYPLALFVPFRREER
jgi:general nucleoside transport system permease protein